MADFVKTHPLGDLAELSQSSGSDSDVTLTIRHGFSTAQVFARRGKESAAADKLKLSTEAGQATDSRNATYLPLSPGQWLAISKKSETAFAGQLSKKLKGLGYASDQSDSRVCFRISGPKARDVMSRGCRLDLHQSVAGKGFCAQTTMAQVGVIIHQSQSDPVYDIYVYSGFARSFWHWLSHTAAQFGYDVNTEAL